MEIVMILLDTSNDVRGEWTSYAQKLPAVEFH